MLSIRGHFWGKNPSEDLSEGARNSVCHWVEDGSGVKNGGYLFEDILKKIRTYPQETMSKVKDEDEGFIRVETWQWDS